MLLKDISDNQLVVFKFVLAIKSYILNLTREAQYAKQRKPYPYQPSPAPTSGICRRQVKKSSWIQSLFKELSYSSSYSIKLLGSACVAQSVRRGLWVMISVMGSTPLYAQHGVHVRFSPALPAPPSPPHWLHACARRLALSKIRNQTAYNIVNTWYNHDPLNPTV